MTPESHYFRHGSMSIRLKREFSCLKAGILSLKEFGLKVLPTERGEVKPVDCPTVDERPCVLKSNGRMKQEKRRDISLRSSCL